MKRGGRLATYGVKSIPLLVIVGRDGRVAHVQTGYGEGSMQEMIDAVNALLAHPATSQGS